MSARPVGFDVPVPASGRAGRRRPGASRGTTPPRPALVKAALVAIGVGLGATTALTLTAETASQLAAPGGRATFAGNLTGMVGTYPARGKGPVRRRVPARRWGV